jgi:hypothetical protein
MVMDSAELLLEWTDALTHPVDRLYFALETLERAGVPETDVESVILYGPDAGDADVEALRTGFAGRVRRMDPCGAVDVSPDRFDPEFRLEAFAACIGAALS